MNNKFKAQSLNRKSYRKFTLSWFSVTCFKYVGLLWPISALDRKQVRGYHLNCPQWSLGPYLNMKTVFPSHAWDFHYRNKTVVRPSYLYDENSYTSKAIHLYWDGPQLTFGLSHICYLKSIVADTPKHCQPFMLAIPVRTGSSKFRVNNMCCSGILTT